MASISESFAELIHRAQLTARDEALFARHRASVTQGMRSRLGTSKAELIGSFARGSAIHGNSDVDIMVVLTRQEATRGGHLKSSATVLRAVHDALSERLPSSRLGRDGQAIVIEFNDGAHPVDVVPGIYCRQGGRLNYPVYLIPDGAGDWLETCPGGHNRYLADADRSAGGKLKYLAQLFKYWRSTRSSGVAVSGFYVELYLATEHICDGAKGYAQMFAELLVMLAERHCESFPDPIGISGSIHAATALGRLERGVRTVSDAASHAAAAVEAEQRGNLREARRQWDSVFKGHFPQ